MSRQWDKQGDCQEEAQSGAHFRTISVSKHAHVPLEKIFERCTLRKGKAAHSVHVALGPP